MGCIEMLKSEESEKLLKEMHQKKQEIGRISIQWQWQCFESLGIDHKFGVSQLGKVNSRFAADREMTTAMLRFQETCQITCWKVMGAPTKGREEVIEDLDEIVTHLKGMSMGEKKALMRDMMPKIQQLQQQGHATNPMEVLENLDTKQDRKKYYMMTLMRQ